MVGAAAAHNWLKSRMPCLEAGYATISFDAPAHGKARGKTSNMIDFIQAILHLQDRYGRFEGAVGHSLGGMSLLNAIKQGLDIDRLVTIGSGDMVTDIVHDFTDTLQLKPRVSGTSWLKSLKNVSAAR